MAHDKRRIALEIEYLEKKKREMDEKLAELEKNKESFAGEDESLYGSEQGSEGDVEEIDMNTGKEKIFFFNVKCIIMASNDENLPVYKL